MEKSAEERFIEASNELVAKGWNQTNLVNLLKENMKPTDSEIKKQKVAERNIKIVRDFLSGMPRKEIVAKYKVVKTPWGNLISSGARHVRRILNIRHDEKMGSIEWNGNKEIWLDRCEQALIILKDQK
jgi:hypothetical protein